MHSHQPYMQVSVSNLLKSIGCFHSYSYLCFFFLIWFLKFFFHFLIFLTTNKIQYFLLHSTLYMFPFMNFQMYILPVFLSESFFIFFLSFFFLAWSKSSLHIREIPLGIFFIIYIANSFFEFIIGPMSSLYMVSI